MTELSFAVGAAGTGGCAAICTVGNGAGVLAIWRSLAGLRGGRMMLTVLAAACFGAALMRGAAVLTAGASSGSRGVILKTASALIAVSTGAATGVVSGVLARLLNSRMPTPVTSAAGTNCVTSLEKSRAANGLV